MKTKEELIPREDKKQEAIRRMKILGIAEHAITHFEKSGFIPFFVTGKDDAKFAINGELYEPIVKFEAEHNALVYCVIAVNTMMGKMHSLLFVSDYEDDWDIDREDIQDGYAMTWTENLDHPMCSEFGSIAVERTPSGALDRIG